MIFPAISALMVLIILASPWGLEPAPVYTDHDPLSPAAVADKQIDEELSQKALEIPPEDLGAAFLANQTMIELIELATRGIRIHTPDGVIDEKTASEKRAEFERRQEIYAAAILQRGFQDFSGKYSLASVTQACARSGSLWVSGALEGAFDAYEIVQSGFRLELAVTLADKLAQSDDIGVLELEGVVVESTMVLADPLNSDYFLEGKGANDRIEIRPRLDVVDAWPEWAGPLKRRDLERCILVLERESSQLVQ